MNLPLPVLSLLRAYDKNWLQGEFIAAITLTAYLSPAANRVQVCQQTIAP